VLVEMEMGFERRSVFGRSVPPFDFSILFFSARLTNREFPVSDVPSAEDPFSLGWILCVAS
jgi:hypothetical protein